MTLCPSLIDSQMQRNGSVVSRFQHLALLVEQHGVVVHPPTVWGHPGCPAELKEGEQHLFVCAGQAGVSAARWCTCQQLTSCHLRFVAGRLPQQLPRQPWGEHVLLAACGGGEGVCRKADLSRAIETQWPDVTWRPEFSCPTSWKSDMVIVVNEFVNWLGHNTTPSDWSCTALLYPATTS